LERHVQSTTEAETKTVVSTRRCCVVMMSDDRRAINELLLVFRRTKLAPREEEYP
jgi:hypothetical protein